MFEPRAKDTDHGPSNGLRWFPETGHRGMHGYTVTPLFPCTPGRTGVGVMKQLVEHQSNELKARLGRVRQWRMGTPSLRAGDIDFPEGDFNFADGSAFFAGALRARSAP